MGCCFGRCFSGNDEDKYADQGADGESSRLLPPIIDGSSSRQSSSYNTTVQTQHQKGDEQSALNRILNQTASDVIDVSAIDSHTMEQHECMDRAREYSTRLALGCAQSGNLKLSPALPAGVAAPGAVLAAQPLSLADIQLVSQAAEQACVAIREVQVKHKEDLVVPFGVP